MQLKINVELHFGEDMINKSSVIEYSRLFFSGGKNGLMNIKKGNQQGNMPCVQLGWVCNKMKPEYLPFSIFSPLSKKIGSRFWNMPARDRVVFVCL